MRAAAARSFTLFGATQLGSMDGERLGGTDQSDIIRGRGGDDTIFGGAGADTYVWASGDGNDLILDTVEAAADIDVVRLIGLDPQDVALTRIGDDLKITAANRTITVAGQFASETTFRGIEQLTFANGSSWNRTEIFDRLVPSAQFTGTPGADSLTGTADSDKLDGREGDDLLQGFAGDDVYVFGRGYGSDTVDDNGPNSGASRDRIAFTADVSPGDVVFSRSGTDLLVRISGTTDQLTIRGGLVSAIDNAGVAADRIEVFEFADHTRITLGDILIQFLRSTSGDDSIQGFVTDDVLDGAAGSDTLAGGQGNDTIIGGAGNDLVRGERGADTFVYARGDGSDTIDESDSFFGGVGDKLVLNAVAPGQVTLERNGDDSILVIAPTTTGGSDGARITLREQLDSRGDKGLEQIVFADGTIWTAGDLRLKTIAAYTTPGNDVIAGFNTADLIQGGLGNDSMTIGDSAAVFGGGSVDALSSIENVFGSSHADILAGDSGANRLVAGGGNDRLIGRGGDDLLSGGSGNDTFVFGPGFGNDTITDFVAGPAFDDVIEFDRAVFVDAAAVLNNAAQVGTDVLITASGGTIRLKDVRLSSLHADDFAFTGIVNNAPTGVSMTGGSVAENSAAGTVVGTLAAVDPDAGDTHAFTLVSGAVDRFEVVGNQLRVKPGAVLDFEAQASYGVTVRATDSGGLSADQALTIVVTNVNEAPLAAAASENGSGPEDTSITGTLLRGTDPDGNTLTFQLVSGSATNGSVTIDAASGAYSFAPAPDYNGSASFRYVVTDGTLVSAEKTVSLTVDPVNDAPIGAVAITGTAQEDQVLTANTATLADADGLGTLHYQWQRSTDGGTTWSNVGTDASAYILGDADVGATMRVRASYTDARGTVESVTSAATAAVANVNDAPTGSVTISGNVQAGENLTASTVTLGDADGLGTLHYAWQRSSDAGATWTSIGTDQASYAVGTADEGTQIRTRVSYIDGHGALEALTSAAVTGSTISGTAGDDTLTGTPTADTLNGLDGNDVLIGGAGADTLNGGLGTDTASYATATTGVVADLTTPANNTGDAAGDVYWSIENLTGSAFADTLVGDGSANVLTGGSANDNLNGGAGNDTLIGGAGADALTGGLGTDTASYASAAAAVVASLTSPTSNTGDAAGDTYSGIENLTGTSFGDTLTGDTGANLLDGGAGNDTLTGAAGGDVYVFGRGYGSDRIDDGSGSTTDVDVLSFRDLNAGDVTLSRAGGDLLVAVNGTGETVTVRYQFYSTTANWGIERISFADGTSWDLATINSKAWIRGTSGNDSLYGSGSNDTFLGGTGNDYAQGAAGSDTYVYRSGDGNDRIDDESGSTLDVDVLSFADLNASDVTLSRSGGDLIVKANATGETVTVNYQFYSITANWGVEQISFADGTSWDLATINSKAWIRGTSGNDSLYGSGWNDTFLGGTGNDYAQGAAGSDTYVYRSGDGNDRIDDESGSTSEVDVLNFADLSASDVTLSRSGGDLIIRMNATGETVTVNYQFYSMTANWGIEWISFANGATWDLATINSNAWIRGTNGNDALSGSSWNETLDGGAGHDSLNGGNGDDRLIGGSGNDVMTGGAGADIFVFGPASGQDTVTDFVAGGSVHDLVEFDHAVFADTSSVIAASAQVGADVVITISATDTITLTNVLLSQLGAADFHFV